MRRKTLLSPSVKWLLLPTTNGEEGSTGQLLVAGGGGFGRQFNTGRTGASRDRTLGAVMYSLDAELVLARLVQIGGPIYIVSAAVPTPRESMGRVA